MRSPPRSRPCRFCRKWFRPDHRAGDRQRACSTAACQQERQRVQQARWRASNPDYFVARRLLERVESAAADDPAPPRPLDRLPWDIAQTEFGAQGAAFIEETARLLLRTHQMQRRVEAVDSS
jgi:hypothetical protein